MNGGRAGQDGHQGNKFASGTGGKQEGKMCKDPTEMTTEDVEK